MKKFKIAVSLLVSTSMVLSITSTAVAQSTLNIRNMTVTEMQERIQSDTEKVLANNIEIARREAIIKEANSTGTTSDERTQRDNRILAFLGIASMGGLMYTYVKIDTVNDASAQKAWTAVYNNMDKHVASDMKELMGLIGKDLDQKTMSYPELSKILSDRIAPLDEKYGYHGMDNLRRQIWMSAYNLQTEDGKTYQTTKASMTKFLNHFEEGVYGTVHHNTLRDWEYKLYNKYHGRRLIGLLVATAAFAAGMFYAHKSMKDEMTEEDRAIVDRIVRLKNSGDEASASEQLDRLVTEVAQLAVESVRLQEEIVTLEAASLGK